MLYSADVLQNSLVFFDFTSDHLSSATYGYYSSKFKKVGSAQNYFRTGGVFDKRKTLTLMLMLWNDDLFLYHGTRTFKLCWATVL